MRAGFRDRNIMSSARSAGGRGAPARDGPARFFATLRSVVAGRPLIAGAVMLLLGAWFFLVFPTEPLYFENQNTKFLHGMALAGIGHLDHDWTANTIDVMPVFTAIVYALHVLTPPAVCYLVQIALFAVFLYSVVAIAAHVAGAAGRSVWFPIVVGVLTVASQFSNGGARVWAGVARQYLLGPALEPQSFGVLFLLAVVWFLKGRCEAALLLAAVPAIVHPGYVVPAGALILAFLLAAFSSPDRAARPRLRVAALSLAAAGASMVWLGLMILPTSAESWQQANEILAKIRIPRHAVPAYWFDFDAAAKIAGAVLTLRLVRRRSRPLFIVIGACFATALGLTLLGVLLDSDEIGMISPWRISVYLVPLCLAALLGFLGTCLERGHHRRGAFPVKGLAAGLVLLALGVTVRGALEKIELYGPNPPAAEIAWVRETGDEGTLYLTDPQNMDFRLETGLPQLVTWKSHPYKDVEVLEWFRRHQLAERVFQGRTLDCAALDEAIATYGVTHLLVEDRAKAVSCVAAAEVFESGAARVFRLSR